MADLAYVNAYRKSVNSTFFEIKESVFYGKHPFRDRSPFVLLDLNPEQKCSVEKAKKYALEQSIKNALSKQNIHVQDSVIIKRNQALILLSRIYVGSISFDIGEEELRKTFAPYGPVKSVALSYDPTTQKHKGFAFIEFEAPEAATLALEQMNGFMLSGRGLKVGRPSNAPQTAQLESEMRSNSECFCRVYVSSIHPELTEADIQTVFEAFGQIESCKLEPDPKAIGKHRGFGYIDFKFEQAAIDAVSSMNLFQLAGQQLRVCRALLPRGCPLPGSPAALLAATCGSGSPSGVVAEPTAASRSGLAACLAAVAAANATISGSVGGVAAQLAAKASGPGSGLTAIGSAVVAAGGGAANLTLNGLSGLSSTPSPSVTTGFSSSSPAVALPPPGIFIPTVSSLSTLPSLASAIVDSLIYEPSTPTVSADQSPLASIPPHLTQAQMEGSPSGTQEGVPTSPGELLHASSPNSSDGLSTSPHSPLPPDDLTYPSPRRNGVDDSQALYSPSLDPIDPELHSSAESPSSLHSDEQLISDAPAELSNELCQIALDNPSNGLLDSYLDEEASLGFQEDFVSNVLLLENMASVEEVDPELEEEVQEECSNYGEVLRLLLHLTPQQEVRIFVHFDAIEAVKAACLALNGRFFGGRVVRARPYDNELFQLKQLDED